MEAKLVKVLNERQSVYEMSPPHVGYKFIVASVCTSMCTAVQGYPECYLFGSDSKGNILVYTELEGSQKGTASHEKVLSDLGYQVTK